MLDKEKMPEHVAIVMDGNGRWAKAKGLPRMAGHNAGMKAMKEIVRRSGELGIKHLTVYAFSTENWKRSVEEVSGIFSLIVVYVEKELKELAANNVQVHVLGDYSVLPEDSVRSLKKAIDATKSNTGLHFNIALNYGGRADICMAAKELAKLVKDGKLEPEEIDEKLIGEHLWTGAAHEDVPDPELIIRTSGELRLSNFLLWQSAYSEFVVTDVLWPDFTPEHFEKCIEEFQHRDRRFGGRKK